MNISDPDLSFALRIFRSAVQLVRLERALGDSRTALRLPKLTALDTLEAAAPITADELAAREGVTQPTIFSTVTYLAHRRFVARPSGSSGSRERPLKVTAQGSKQLRRERQRLAYLLDGLDEAENETLRDAISILERQISRFYRDEQEKTKRARRRVGIKGGTR